VSHRQTTWAIVSAALCCLSTASAATESIEFVQEHLAEVPMDNRYATLPLWGQAHPDAHRAWQFEIEAAYSRTQVGTLVNDGPSFGAGVGHRLGADTRLTAFAFFDGLSLSSGIEHRPLEVLFARDVPLTLPAAAEFTGLAGTAKDMGFGVALRRDASLPVLHDFQWTVGALWQRVALDKFSFNYRVLDGPDAGTAGTLDYSANYSHIAAIAGLAWPRTRGQWAFTPHLQLAVPLPRRGVVGRITGPGFDVRGDTATAGAGKHFGDPSITAGFDVTYRPWNLTVDLGNAVSQALLEPVTHKGIRSNWLLSLRWNY
jgi:hypothetical protein